MTHDLHIIASGRNEQYRQLIPQIHALWQDEPDALANLANFVSALKYGLNFYWVGIYRVVGDELVLGVFQGPPACTRIARGKGVCGTCMESKKTILVPDVDAFPGHIACSALSRSEITVPLMRNEKLVGILDIDSDQPGDFSQTDVNWLEQLAGPLAQWL